jgi:hypothetical protein
MAMSRTTIAMGFRPPFDLIVDASLGPATVFGLVGSTYRVKTI